MSKLNKAQQKAVEENNKPLLIIAGAGTGKTTVITKKIAYLIEKGLAKPEEILALTFTDKASHEMTERVDSLINLGYTDMQISTFHSFCQRILEHHGLDAGLPNQFKMLTSTDAWLLIRKYLNKFDLDYYRPLGNPGKFIHALINHFSKCKDELISPQDYLDYAKNKKTDSSADANADEKSRLIEIAGAYQTYNQILLDHDALDFGDLIFYTIKILEKRPNILKDLQNRYKYILIDEFQDVNWSQYYLVRLLSKKANLCVVGDEDQSIYAFRGASVSNIMRFYKDYKDSQQVVLNENYRSGQKILDLAYTSIQNNNPDRLEVKLDINKKLKAKGAIKTGSVEHLHLPTVDDEVKTVIDKIVDIKKTNPDSTWDDFAILVRANNHAEPFLNALEKAGIPYEFLASKGLYRQPIILDCINFFKAINSYHESSAIYRLLRIPFFEFSENDMQKLLSFAKKKSYSYYEVIKQGNFLKLSQKGIKTCNNLLKWIHAGMKETRYLKPTEVLVNFLDSSGYFKFLAKQENQNNREVIRQIYQLQQFLDYIRTYEDINPDATVAEFLDHMNYVVDSGDAGDMPKFDDTPDSVNVLTAHSSKGLEFPYVFIVNLVEDRFPSRRRGESIEIPEELIKEDLPEGDFHIEEERRLFYVAVTRAKEKLFLLSADNYNGVRNKKISRFLAEISDILNTQEIKIQKQDLINLENNKSKKNKEKAKFIYELPKTFSFSKINSYQRCPYQFKLAHVLSIPTKGGPQLSFGNTMHNTLQKFYERVIKLNSAQQESLFAKKPKVEAKDQKKEENKEKIKVPSLDELLEIYKKAWIEDWYHSKKQKQDYFKKGQDILQTFYQNHEDNWTIPVSLEGWFKIKIGDYFINGRIDRIDQINNDKMQIIDYKTGTPKEKVTGDDKNQLLLYQIATQTLPEYKHYGEVEKLTYYYLNDDSQVDFIGKDKDIEKLKEKIANTIKKIEDKNFTATPNPHICKFCDYKDICEFKKL